MYNTRRSPSAVCSLGTLESTKAVYESILDLRIATAQIVLNYGTLMSENKFFEEAFRWGQRWWRHWLCVWVVGWCCYYHPAVAAYPILGQMWWACLAANPLSHPPTHPPTLPPHAPLQGV
jgi:hypothetical protein